MPTNYTIYLINQSSSTQTFWCFLARPQEVASDPSVFANSSASLAIDSNDPATNSFTIPVQYVVAAGASNNAVGLNVKVNSTISQNSDLSQVWDATYADAPPNKGPKLSLNPESVGPNSLKIISNPFAQDSNESLGWYASQSFGIQTEAGFMGMSWSPSPNKSRTLTPKLSFYVSTGEFGSSTLADWTQVSNDSAQVNVPGNFIAGACTVTLLNNGKWKITPGKPTKMMLMSDLGFLTSEAHGELMALAYLESDKVQKDEVTSVSWPKQEVLNAAVEGGEADTYLTGTITVATALAASFAFFIISGVQFTITRPARGRTTVEFSYSGQQSVQQIKDLVVAGANALFGGAPKD